MMYRKELMKLVNEWKAQLRHPDERAGVCRMGSGPTANRDPSTRLRGNRPCCRLPDQVRSHQIGMVVVASLGKPVTSVIIGETSHANPPPTAFEASPVRNERVIWTCPLGRWLLGAALAMV